MSNDHITIPKSTLLEFSNSGVFHYLDLKTNQINRASARSYNTKANYYPPEMEQYLSGSVESCMGRIRALLKAFTEGHKDFCFYPGTKEDAVKCFAVQLLRNPYIIEQARANSILGNSLPLELYSPLHQRTRQLLDKSIAIAEKNLANYDINIAIIKKDKSFSFILPTDHFLNTGKNIFLVLSPYHALILLPREDNSKFYTNDGFLQYCEFENYSELEPLYIRTLKTEMKYNPSHIIGLKNQLEILQKYVETGSSFANSM